MKKGIIKEKLETLRLQKRLKALEERAFELGVNILTPFELSLEERITLLEERIAKAEAALKAAEAAKIAAEKAAKKEARAEIVSALAEIREAGVSFEEALDLLKEGSETQYEKYWVSELTKAHKELSDIPQLKVSEELKGSKMYNILVPKIKKIESKRVKALDFLWDCRPVDAMNIVASMRSIYKEVKPWHKSVKVAIDMFNGNLDKIAKGDFAKIEGVRKLSSSWWKRETFRFLIKRNLSGKALSVFDKEFPSAVAEAFEASVVKLQKKFNGNK